jgi:XTP/dITP diphosphohydrolase
MRLVVATFNRDKLGEMAALLADPGLELAALCDFPAAAPPEESGASLVENARIKARAALAVTGLPALADDTALEVDALGGAPGIRAARFAGPGASYAENLRKLLDSLRDVPREGRTARFRTACVVCLADGREIVTEGVLEGRIASVPRGAGGFGYDPAFEVEGTGRTLAEMTPGEKNAISHRARALRAMVERLIAAR